MRPIGVGAECAIGCVVSPRLAGLKNSEARRKMDAHRQVTFRQTLRTVISEEFLLDAYVTHRVYTIEKKLYD